jgi:hypothetical protein
MFDRHAKTYKPVCQAYSRDNKGCCSVEYNASSNRGAFRGNSRHLYENWMPLYAVVKVIRAYAWCNSCAEVCRKHGADIPDPLTFRHTQALQWVVTASWNAIMRAAAVHARCLQALVLALLSTTGLGFLSSRPTVTTLLGYLFVWSNQGPCCMQRMRRCAAQGQEQYLPLHVVAHSGTPRTKGFSTSRKHS